MQRYIRRGQFKGPNGEKSGNAVLTPEKVLMMRNSDLPNSYFARLYRLSGETIRRARVGETWSWLGDDGLAIELAKDDELFAGLIDAPKASSPLPANIDVEAEASMQRAIARFRCGGCGDLNCVDNVCKLCGWIRGQS